MMKMLILPLLLLLILSCKRRIRQNRQIDNPPQDNQLVGTWRLVEIFSGNIFSGNVPGGTVYREEDGHIMSDTLPKVFTAVYKCRISGKSLHL